MSELAYRLSLMRHALARMSGNHPVHPRLRAFYEAKAREVASRIIAGEVAK
jgi:hypothetical protein